MKIQWQSEMDIVNERSLPISSQGICLMFLFIEGLYESEGGLKMKKELNSSSVMMFYLLLVNLSFRAPYTAAGCGVETSDQTAARTRTSCDRVSVG